MIRIKGFFSRLVVVTCATSGDLAAPIASPEHRASIHASSSSSSGGASGSRPPPPPPPELAQQEERTLAGRRREMMTNTFYKALGKHVAPFCEPVLLPFVPSEYFEVGGVRPDAACLPRGRSAPCRRRSPARPPAPPAPRLSPGGQSAPNPPTNQLHQPRPFPPQASSLLFRAASAAGDELDQFHALFRRRCELLDDLMLERPYDEQEDWDRRAAERLALERPLLRLAHDGVAPVYEGAVEALLEADIATMRARAAPLDPPDPRFPPSPHLARWLFQASHTQTRRRAPSAFPLCPVPLPRSKCATRCATTPTTRRAPRCARRPPWSSGSGSPRAPSSPGGSSLS